MTITAAARAAAVPVAALGCAAAAGREACGWSDGVAFGRSSFVEGRVGVVHVQQSSVTRLQAHPGKDTKSGFGWFKFGSNGMDSEGAGIYGSQKREDFDRDDVEQYFNYMGMLATEGTYDKMDSLLNTGVQAVDILLLLASSEGDQPKIEELLKAGADHTVKDDQGRNSLDRAKDEDIRELILSKSRVTA